MGLGKKDFGAEKNGPRRAISRENAEGAVSRTREPRRWGQSCYERSDSVRFDNPLHLME